MSTSSSEQDLARTVLEQLDWDGRVDASHIEVLVSEDTVTLKGTVPCHFTRLAAVDSARALCGDRDVRDQLAIAYPSRPSTPASEAIRSAWPNGASTPWLLAGGGTGNPRNMVGFSM